MCVEAVKRLGECILDHGVRAPSVVGVRRAKLAGPPHECQNRIAAGGIAADSLAPKRVGELMFPIAQRYIDRVVLVPDDAIEAAQNSLWNILRVAAEPGGAAAFAALFSGRYQPRPGERVGIVVCGGNTTAVNFGSNGR